MAKQTKNNNKGEEEGKQSKSNKEIKDEGRRKALSDFGLVAGKMGSLTSKKEIGDQVGGKPMRGEHCEGFSK